ncbi:MAG: D,D-heptose 1,7-bisphosphate phosphatase [Gemmatimonadetes bacterium]|nr:D,D-heptose 1,7-bisphosphate phosphatase [Gemmatimonadota bacterium]
MIRPAVFLDRDGTVNVERSYITRPEDIHLIPHAATAIGRLKAAGYAVVLVTNQAAVAKGLLTEVELGGIHKHLESLLSCSGVFLDAIYYCPHHSQFPSSSSDPECSCRKPSPGMILQAARDLDLDLGKSFMVGDSLSDLQAGWSAGCRAALVLTGHGEHTHLEASDEDLRRVDLIAESLADVGEWICGLQPSIP